MKIFFVKADLIGSKLIRWATGQCCSHVAIVSDTFETVYHSYGKGMERQTTKEFYKKYTIMHTISVYLSAKEENELLEHLAIHTENVGYDYTAFLYFAWRVFLNKIFKIQYPKVNKWENKEKFLCTEALYAFIESYALVTGSVVLIKNAPIAMLTPHDLYLEIKDSF